MHIHTHTRTHTHTHTHSYLHTPTHQHTLTHSCPHPHTYTHTFTGTDGKPIIPDIDYELLRQQHINVKESNKTANKLLKQADHLLGKIHVEPSQ